MLPANFSWRVTEEGEKAMSGILDKFYVEHGAHGSRVLARSLQLTSYLSDDDNIDTMIDLLKEDLDACAREIKRVARINARSALFEGWGADA